MVAKNITTGGRGPIDSQGNAVNQSCKSDHEEIASMPKVDIAIKGESSSTGRRGQRSMSQEWIVMTMTTTDEETLFISSQSPLLHNKNNNNSEQPISSQGSIIAEPLQVNKALETNTSSFDIQNIAYTSTYESIFSDSLSSTAKLQYKNFLKMQTENNSHLDNTNEDSIVSKCVDKNRTSSPRMGDSSVVTNLTFNSVECQENGSRVLNSMEHNSATNTQLNKNIDSSEQSVVLKCLNMQNQCPSSPNDLSMINSTSEIAPGPLSVRQGIEKWEVLCNNSGKQNLPQKRKCCGSVEATQTSFKELESERTISKTCFEEKNHKQLKPIKNQREVVARDYDVIYFPSITNDDKYKINNKSNKDQTIIKQFEQKSTSILKTEKEKMVIAKSKSSTSNESGRDTMTQDAYDLNHVSSCDWDQVPRDQVSPIYCRQEMAGKINYDEVTSNFIHDEFQVAKMVSQKSPLTEVAEEFTDLPTANRQLISRGYITLTRPNDPNVSSLSCREILLSANVWSVNTLHTVHSYKCTKVKEMELVPGGRPLIIRTKLDIPSRFLTRLFFQHQPVLYRSSFEVPAKPACAEFILEVPPVQSLVVSRCELPARLQVFPLVTTTSTDQIKPTIYSSCYKIALSRSSHEEELLKSDPFGSSSFNVCNKLEYSELIDRNHEKEIIETSTVECSDEDNLWMTTDGIFFGIATLHPVMQTSELAYAKKSIITSSGPVYQSSINSANYYETNNSSDIDLSTVNNVLISGNSSVDYSSDILMVVNKPSQTHTEVVTTEKHDRHLANSYESSSKIQCVIQTESMDKSNVQFVEKDTTTFQTKTLACGMETNLADRLKEATEIIDSSFSIETGILHSDIPIIVDMISVTEPPQGGLGPTENLVRPLANELTDSIQPPPLALDTHPTSPLALDICQSDCVLEVYRESLEGHTVNVIEHSQEDLHSCQSNTMVELSQGQRTITAHENYDASCNDDCNRNTTAVETDVVNELCVSYMAVDCFNDDVICAENKTLLYRQEPYLSIENETEIKTMHLVGNEINEELLEEYQSDGEKLEGRDDVRISVLNYEHPKMAEKTNIEKQENTMTDVREREKIKRVDMIEKQNIEIQETTHLSNFSEPRSVAEMSETDVNHELANKLMYNPLEKKIEKNSENVLDVDHLSNTVNVKEIKQTMIESSLETSAKISECRKSEKTAVVRDIENNNIMVADELTTEAVDGCEQRHAHTVLKKPKGAVIDVVNTTVHNSEVTAESYSARTQLRIAPALSVIEYDSVFLDNSTKLIEASGANETKAFEIVTSKLFANSRATESCCEVFRAEEVMFELDKCCESVLVSEECDSLHRMDLSTCLPNTDQLALTQNYNNDQEKQQSVVNTNVCEEYEDCIQEDKCSDQEPTRISDTEFNNKSWEETYSEHTVETTATRVTSFDPKVKQTNSSKKNTSLSFACETVPPNIGAFGNTLTVPECLIETPSVKKQGIIGQHSQISEEEGESSSYFSETVFNAVNTSNSRPTQKMEQTSKAILDVKDVNLMHSRDVTVRTDHVDSTSYSHSVTITTCSHDFRVSSSGSDVVVHQYAEMYSFFSRPPVSAVDAVLRSILLRHQNNYAVRRLLVEYPALRPSSWAWTTNQESAVSVHNSDQTVDGSDPNSHHRTRVSNQKNSRRDQLNVETTEITRGSLDNETWQEFSIKFEPLIERFTLVS